MRAALYDMEIETGATVVRRFQMYVPSEAIAASSLQPGERVYYKGEPLPVFAVTNYVNPTRPELSTVEIVFNEGLWYDPRVKVGADDLVRLAVPAELLAGEASMATPGEDGEPDTYPFSVTIADGDTAVLTIDAVDTAEFGWVEGSWSWDLYVQTADDAWHRLVEGTVTVIRGTTRHEAPVVP